MRALTDYDVESLGALLAGWGYKPSHAPRLLRAFYGGAGQVDPVALGVGKALSARLGADLPLRRSAVLDRAESADGTVKLLVGLGEADRGGDGGGGGAVESVLMPAYERARAAGCVSSQIGCAMGCDFCASTKRGLERNLEAGEIVEQFLHLKAEAQSRGRRLTTLVFMGMGEPMHNLENVMAAIRRIAGTGMGELGWKQVTVSTVGIVPGIRRLAEANLNVHLALSLHAPDDETRSRLVPPNRRYGVGEVVAAARAFQERTGRIVTVEYCMLAGVNDSDAQASQLADVLAGFRAHVNLIPYNAIGAGVSGVVYARPSAERVRRFLEILTERGAVAHCRRTRGDDVNAACGQLREMAASAGAGGA